MRIIVTDEAANWFKEEVGLYEGAGIRFLPKIYGCSPINSSFSLAMEGNVPVHPSVTVETDNGVLFYIEDGDEWFFDGHDLVVEYDAQLQEPKYVYKKEGV